MTARPSDLDHGAGLVTDAAVEAAEAELARRVHNWTEGTRREQCRWVLEAAAPDIAAKALRDAAEREKVIRDICVTMHLHGDPNLWEAARQIEAVLDRADQLRAALDGGRRDGDETGEAGL